MAEERNLGLARAVAETGGGEEDSTKAELQRRMEEARESITQTVTEIKDTVTNQYQAVKSSVTEALDWREQYRKRPVVWSVSALSVGFILGYSLGGAFMDDGSDREESPWDVDDYEPTSTTSAASLRSQTPQVESVRGAAAMSSAPHAPSYASQAITGAVYGSSSGEGSSLGRGMGASDSSPAYGGEAEEAAPEKPGLIERFKETRAYDRLQEEVSTLGDRFIDELAKVGQTVVLPALFGKIKEMFGVDLSNKQQGQSSSSGSSAGGSQRQQATGGAQTGVSSASAGSQTSGAGGGSTGAAAGSAYGTSENRGYGASSSDRDDYGRGSSSSGQI